MAFHERDKETDALVRRLALERGLGLTEAIDCLAYACAKAHGQPLLYEGDDFARTDITAA